MVRQGLNPQGCAWNLRYEQGGRRESPAAASAP